MKRSSDVGAEQVEQQSACNREAHPAPQQITSYKIEEVSNRLRTNDAYSQSPSPKAMFEPADGSGNECRAQKEEQTADRPASG